MNRLRTQPLPATIRTLTDEEADRLDKQVPDIPDPKDCVTCSGTRTFRWWDHDRTEIVDWDCVCDEQWILHRYLLHSGVGTNYQRLAWADLTDVEPEALAKAAEYLSNPGYIRNGMGLILYGEMGTGKTTLSSLVIRKLLADGHRGYSTTFSALIDTFASGWRDASDKAWFYRRIKNAGILVIDDVGREMKGRNSISEPILDEVLRHRISTAKPTIVTTNYDLERLEVGYGANILALLSEVSSTYHFTQGEFRMSGKHRARKIQEIQNNLTRPLVLG